MSTRAHFQPIFKISVEKLAKKIRGLKMARTNCRIKCPQ